MVSITNVPTFNVQTCNVYMDIRDKVVIITGASGGIGAATARELARQGAVVVLAARRADQLAALKDQIEQAGGRALAVPTDVGQRADINQLVQTTVAAFGRVDVLINNAGIGGNTALGDSDDELIRRVIDVNLIAPARCVQAVLPHMRQAGQGVIVNIGSVAGEVATSTLYSASKFGLRGFNDALRRELRHDNIDVVLIAPGFIRTDMTSDVKVPMPGPEVVAQAVTSAIRRPRRKLIVPWPYRLFTVAAKVPWLADLVLGGNAVQRGYRNRKRPR
jgi:NAD(P)-dependent dehydrogenase (short-subunit alcohol dehydrogenase family)